MTASPVSGIKLDMELQSNKIIIMLATHDNVDITLFIFNGYMNFIKMIGNNMLTSQIKTTFFL